MIISRTLRGTGRAIATAVGSLLLPFSARPGIAADALAPGVGAGDVLGLGASLLIVIGTVVVVGWLYSRRPRGAGGGVIRILAAQPLGSKERIVLVDVGGTQMVLGMTSAQVQTLHVFDAPVFDDSEQQAVAGAFSKKLGKLLKGQKA